MSIVKDFNNDKSSDIPIIVIKHCAPVIASTLCRLYNECIKTGKFPDVLKCGKITPIHKKGPRDDLTNYRPISTLPIFGKIFEEILYKRIFSFINTKGILSDTQFGFRECHSTSHAIHHSVNFIKQAHAQKMHVLGILIDLSKAFDTIDHKILLQKLYNYGICGNAHNLMLSYLTNRYQYVKIGNEISDKLLVKYGVPQGSVLGPLLFLLYINDLHNIVNSQAEKQRIKIILYADDTNIFISCKSVEDSITLANKILLKINDYMNANFLHINADKSCYMHFPSVHKINASEKITRNTKRTSKKAKIDNSFSKILVGTINIKEVTEAKFLGVIFDSGLDWSIHVSQLIKKLKVASATIKRISHFIPASSYKNISHSIRIPYGLLYFCLGECKEETL